MRKLGIALAVVIGLIIIAIVALPYLLDVNQYRGKIQSELQARTGRVVSLGQMDLKIMPFAFRVKNAVIGEDPHFPSTKPFAQAEELLVSVKLRPLLSKRVEVDSLELKKPRIEMVRSEQGQWNFSTIGKPQTAQAPAQPTPAQKPSGAQPPPQQPTPQPQEGQAFELGRLLITDGQIAVTDYQKKQARVVYDNIDLDLKDYKPGKPVTIDLAAHLPGGGKQEFRLTGKGGPLQDDLLKSDFNGSLKLDGVSLAGVKSYLGSSALADMDFVATGSTDLSNKQGVISAKGNITLQNARVRKTNIGYPIAADFDVTDDTNRDFITIHKGDLKLGSTPVDVKGTFNAAPTPAQIDLRAIVKNASIADAAKLAGAFGVAFNPGMDVKGTVDADITAKGSAASPVMNGTLASKELDISGKQLAQPVHVSQVSVALTPTSIRSNEFVASTGSTQVRVAFTMNNYNSDSKTVDATMRAPNAQLGELIAIGQAYGVEALEGVSGSGPVSIDVHASGAMKSLNYAGTIAMQNASLKTPQLVQPVRVSQLNMQFSPTQIRSNQFTATTGSTSVQVALAMNNYTSDRATVDATVKAPNAQLGELLGLAKTYKVEALNGVSGTGAVSLDLRVTGPTKNPNALNYSGGGSLQNANLTVPAFTKPIQVRNANLSFSQNAVTLNNAAFTVGSTHANGQLTLRGLAANATPQAQFSLNADTFNVNEWKGMMSNEPVKAAASWSLIPAAHAQAKAAQPTLLERLTGGGTITIGNVIYDEMQLANVKGNVTLDHGLIRISPINANVYGGNLGGTVLVDTRPTPATYTVNTKLSGVDANKLLSSMSNLKQTLFGVLAANADTRFTGSAGGNSTDTARTLNGKLNLNLQNGRLAGIDMLNQLASIGKFLNLTKEAQTFTNIAKLTGDFDVRNGVAHTDNLLAAIDGGDLGAKGDIDLANQTINMSATAVLSQQMAEQVGGTGIGGYLSTALANSKGELVMPVLITGSLTAPKVQPDLQTIAKMKIQNVTSPSGLSGILGAITGKQQNTQQPQQQAQPANGQQPNAQGQPAQQQGQPQQQPGQQQQQKPASPVQSILDALSGKKPQQQQQPAQQQPQQQQQQQQQKPPDEDTLPDPSKPKI
jgi:uncharacterized protein involved in outer membrane biogenesis